MNSSRRYPPTKATTSKRVTYALAGAGLAVMALPLVTALLPGEAGATRVPSQAAATTSIGVTSIVPTDPTVPRSTLVIAGSVLQSFNPGLTTYTVSTNICTVEVVVSGAAGGNIGATLAGRGSSVKGQFNVAAGDKYDITVGAYRGGGTGGLADLNGGAATKIVKQSSAALIIEAGGGGGDSLVVLTRTNASLDTIPGQTALVGSTVPPFIKVNAVPGRGADAPGLTAVTPITAAVLVPIGDAASSPTSIVLVPKSVTAAANGAATDSGTAILGRDVAPGTTEFIASVKVEVFKGGAGGGGSANSGGADADAGSAGTILYPTSTTTSVTPTLVPPPSSTNSYNAPYAVGAAVGGSGGQNTIGNGFLKTADGINDQKDGKVTLREIVCGSSTLPPLGGGRGASGPLVPAAVALIGAGLGMLVVRRRGARPSTSA